jgi:peroxiredoxin
LTEYQRRYAALREADADVVALSVDEPLRTEALRRQLDLDYPILCDVSRSVVRAWDLYNPREAGGIAIPAVFVIDADRRIRYRSIDATTSRVSADGVLGFLRGEPVAPERASVRAGLSDFARALGNAIRRGMTSKTH